MKTLIPYSQYERLAEELSKSRELDALLALTTDVLKRLSPKVRLKSANAEDLRYAVVALSNAMITFVRMHRYSEAACAAEAKVAIQERCNLDRQDKYEAYSSLSVSYRLADDPDRAYVAACRSMAIIAYGRVGQLTEAVDDPDRAVKSLGRLEAAAELDRIPADVMTYRNWRPKTTIHEFLDRL